MASATLVQQAAGDAYRAGLAIVPPREDGSKAPLGTWKQFRSERPSPSQMRSWYGASTGIGVVTGAVSGNLIALDFDDASAWDQFRSLAHDAELDGLVQRLIDGYAERTPAGGVHLLWRCAEVGGNQKLARRLKTETERTDPNDTIKTLVETRAEGGYLILAPSNGRVHPSGGRYERISGSFATIPTISPEEQREVLNLCRALDQMPARAAQPVTPSAAAAPTSDRPGDAFAAATTWAEILEPHGWQAVAAVGDTTHWRRPGKRDGISGTTNHAGSDFLFVFSTSTPFEAERSYTKFGAFATLNHGGDLAAAAQALADQGFGAPAKTRTTAAPPDGPTSVVLPHPAPALRVDQVPSSSPASARVDVAGAGRTFEHLGEGRYRLSVPTAGITLEIDQLRNKWDERVGELLVACTLPGASTIGADGTISVGDLNLSSVRARQERATLLDRRTKDLEIDWFSLLEQFCQRVLVAERAGSPAILLAEASRPSPDTVIDLDLLRVLIDQPQILFGDGGALKSQIALAVLGELARRGHRPALFDWEADAPEHRERLERQFGSAMPPVYYVRCERPLVDEVDHLRRVIADHHITFPVVDNIALACDGPPEAAEVAGRFFRSLRSLKVGSLLIAHVNKSETGDQKPFGSNAWHNHARATWFIKRDKESPNASEVTVGIYNRKFNNGPILPPRGFGVTFDATRTWITRTDLAANDEFRGSLPTWQRIVSLLRAGPLTEAEIVGELQANPETVRKAITRGTKLFTRLTTSDGLVKVALVERRIT